MKYDINSSVDSSLMDNSDIKEKLGTAKPKRESKFEFDQSSISKNSIGGQIVNNAVDMDFSKASDDEEDSPILKNAYGKPVSRR